MKNFYTLCLSFLLACCCTLVQASTITSIQSGTWTDAATWDCTCVPTAADDVFVDAHTISIGSLLIVVNNLTLTGLAQLQGDANITINGDFQLTLALVYSGNITVIGNMTWGAGNFYNAGTVTVNGVTNLIGYLGPGSQGDKYTTKPFNLNGGAIWVEGRIFADNGGSFTLPLGQIFTVDMGNGNSFPLGGFFSPDGVFNLNGTLDLVSGTMSIVNFQSFNNAGKLIIQSGAVFNNQSVFNNTGTLAGDGTFNSPGTFTQNGSISPGDSPGILTLSTLPSGTTTTYIEMEGNTTPGMDYDQIAVTGVGIISGILDISFLNSYEPTLNDEFIIMTCSGGCSGSFSNIVHPGNNPNAWQIDMTNPNEVKLVLAQSLPVELVSLTVKVLNENTAQIQWKTAIELNNYGFYIEKSIDGHRFEDIGFVRGVGISYQEEAYQYQDEAFRQDAYYRLRQVDFDGRAALSQVVFLRYEGKDGNRISVYPSPANTLVTVEAISNHSSAFLEIKNSLGNLVLKEKMTPETERHTIDVSKLPPGIYFISTEGNLPVQFVKQ